MSGEAPHEPQDQGRRSFETRRAHADRLSERIRQLGGEPHLDPSHLLSKSHTEYREGTTLADMIKEDLIAERIAVESYTEMIAFDGEKGRT